MKTLTVEEAVSGLGQWLEQALAGEDMRSPYDRQPAIASLRERTKLIA
jgi:hypothetical protein